MLRQKHMQDHRNGPAGKAGAVSLAVFVCFYSFGVCFSDHNQEEIVVHGLEHCCECPGHCEATPVPSGQFSCRHHHGHDGFHFHRMTPVLAYQQDREALLAMAKENSRVSMTTSAAFGQADTIPERGQQSIPPVLSPAALTPPGHNTPLLL